MRRPQRRVGGALAALLPLVLGASAAAQQRPVAAEEPALEARSHRRGAVAVGLGVGVFEMTNAADSWDAVFDGPMTSFGLYLEVGLARRWLATLAADWGTADGEQVLLTDPPQPTGVDVSLDYEPIHLTLGWVAWARERWRLHLGLGPTVVRWSEAAGPRSRSATDYGGHALVGLRREVGRFSLGGDLRWSAIPDAVGDGGVSEYFGEDDIGGLGLTLLGAYRLR
ncbi:MAG TPA: hypothetical protein VMT16_03725 [Thermoanaerobaculia bacterium]|nr:hypothetical protein [Thermoanaerobaculia bacterium]